jgi:hypothetical protein
MPDAKPTRRSSAQVQEDKKAKANGKNQVAAKQVLVQERIAQLEEELGIAQMRRDMEAANPPAVSLTKVRRSRAKDLKEVQEHDDMEDVPIIELTADEQETYVCHLVNFFCSENLLMQMKTVWMSTRQLWRMKRSRSSKVSLKTMSGRTAK